VTPSLEARFSLQAARASGKPGKLAPTGKGLEISGKGVLVTAFGPNPDGAGTVLRLWEYAGKSGVRQVRLPPGIAVKSVQPVDLRGNRAGEPIPVRGGKFSCDLGAFAPASFLIETPN
jgi:alpha-mannosidase